MAKKLTQVLISDLAPDDKIYDVRDTIVPGLLVRIFVSGTKHYMLNYYDNAKKRHYKKISSCEMISLAEARERAKEVLKKISLGDTDPWGTEMPKNKMTLRELIEEHYEPWVLVNRRSGPKTIAILKQGFRDMLKFCVDDITLIKVEKQIQDTKNSGSVKSSTINRRSAAIKALFSWAKNRNLIIVNPLERLELLKETDVEEKTRFLAEEEYVRLMRALDEREERIRSEYARVAQHLNSNITRIRPGKFADYLKPLVLTDINSGIRYSALTKLLLSDLDFDKRFIYLTRSTSKGFKTQYIGMNDTVFNVLSEWVKQVEGLSIYLFPSPKNFDKPISSIKTAWLGVLRKAKIEGFRFHDLRHDFASQLVMKGTDLYTVAELLGHSDIRITKRYAHLSSKYLGDAVKKLDGR